MSPTIEILENRIAPATFTVTTTANAGDGSLRQALLDANAAAGLDTITFNIAGAGVQTITPTSALPTISEGVKILGNTQPGFAGTPLIELDGSAAGDGSSGLRSSSANGSVFRALCIHSFGFSGIQLSSSNDNKIVGCYLGVDPTGQLAEGNGDYGVRCGIFSNNNVIGGDTAAERNVISGNDAGNIYISQSTLTKVTGNYIGTTASGKTALGNPGDDIEIVSSSTNVLIGGLKPGEGNVIAGSSEAGISVIGADFVQILGNKIGTDKSGTHALGNGIGVEVRLNDGVVNIGIKSAPNLISGNTGNGVVIDQASQVAVRGNFIGTSAVGKLDLGNGGDGVQILAGSTSNVIGHGGQGNVIAFNTGSGVSMAGSDSSGNQFSRNKFFANGGLAIDLGDDGVTPNDFLDEDTGPNDLLNFPFFTSATAGTFGSKLKGVLNVPASTNGYTVEFYIAAADPLDHGEGQRYLGKVVLAADAGPGFTFKTPVNLMGKTITALVYDRATGDTSEFSVNLEIPVA